MTLPDQIDLRILALAALTAGLTPFKSEPHIVEEARMLFVGTLVKPINILEILTHLTPRLRGGSSVG